MANNVYTALGTPLTAKDSGGSVVITASSLGNAAARVSARLDLGALPRTRFFRWSVDTQWVATPTANKSLDLFLAPWDDDTTPAIDWGIPGAADAVLTVTKRLNMLYAGSVRVESAAVGPFRSGGLIEVPWRYVSVALYNDGGVALAAVGTYATVVTLTPYYDQIQ